MSPDFPWKRLLARIVHARARVIASYHRWWVAYHNAASSSSSYSQRFSVCKTCAKSSRVYGYPPNIIHPVQFARPRVLLWCCSRASFAGNGFECVGVWFFVWVCVCCLYMLRCAMYALVYFRVHRIGYILTSWAAFALAFSSSHKHPWQSFLVAVSKRVCCFCICSRARARCVRENIPKTCSTAASNGRQ